MQSPHTALVFFVATALFAGCSGGTSSVDSTSRDASTSGRDAATRDATSKQEEPEVSLRICAPGAQVACACPDTKITGVQVCGSVGETYGPCTGCPDLDASSQVDAFHRDANEIADAHRDSPDAHHETPDARHETPDATGKDAAVDAHRMPPPPDASAPDAGLDAGGADGGVSPLIYAHTDTELYSFSATTGAVTDLGTFLGMSGTAYDGNITDLAVDAAGDIYVNTETVIYAVTLPEDAGPGATVQLTEFATFNPGLTDSGIPVKKFYALGFAPPGAVGFATIASGETLIAGDSTGELWAIGASGIAVDAGGFGPNAAIPGDGFALSGDVVFYSDGRGNPVGLATIRSCASGGTGACINTSDYLATIDMAALKANTTSSGPLAPILGGIYGGTAMAPGTGTGYGDLFGLAASGSSVFAFSRCRDCYDGGADVPPHILSIDTTTGVGTLLPSSFSFVNGWSGAGVTDSVSVTVPLP